MKLREVFRILRPLRFLGHDLHLAQDGAIRCRTCGAFVCMPGFRRIKVSCSRVWTDGSGGWSALRVIPDCRAEQVLKIHES